MLALAKIPDNYLEWNHIHGAPFGRKPMIGRLKKPFVSEDEIERIKGPFAIQPNNSTREFEYPWAFEAAKLSKGMTTLEIGGGLAGFQFVLDGFGCKVVNVDPGMEAEGVGWPCDNESMAKLNKRFNANVDLRNTTIEKADLKDNSFDRAFSISVIEHLPDANIIEVMQHVHRSLKPGGLFIFTLDLFLNLHPFCSRASNNFGKNQNAKWMTEIGKWEMVVGKPAELFGFAEFNADTVQSNLDKYLIGRFYPTLVQCVVLKKV
jgi:SAM-dependent methyltransferase